MPLLTELGLEGRMVLLTELRPQAADGDWLAEWKESDESDWADKSDGADKGKLNE